MSNQVYGTAAPSLPMDESRRSGVPMIALLVGLFGVLAATLSYLPMWNNVVKGLGVVLVIAFIVRAISIRIIPPPEAIIFILWVVWSVTGVFVGVEWIFFWTHWQTIVQIGVLILILTAFSQNRATLSFSMLMVIVAGMGLTAYSVRTGEFGGTETHERAGSTLAPNLYASVMLMMAGSLAYFWVVLKRPAIIVRLLLTGGFAVAVAGTVASGSRKSVLILPVFLLLWLFLCYRKDLMRRPVLLIGVLAIFLAGGVVTFQRVMQSSAGKRLVTTIEALQGYGSSDAGMERVVLYKKAFELIAESPVFGIGLNNFMIKSGLGLMTHSDYTEVAVSTGIPGFVLYFSLFVVLFVRLRRIIKHTDNPTTAKIAKLILAAMVALMLTGLGMRFYSVKVYWLFVAPLMGWSHGVWREIRQRRAMTAPARGYPIQPTYPVRQAMIYR